LSPERSAADSRANLAEAIFDLAYVTGRFRLRSGADASEYFDKYRFEADPRILRWIAEQLGHSPLAAHPSISATGVVSRPQDPEQSPQGRLTAHPCRPAAHGT
jgi:hypothetical protein